MKITIVQGAFFPVPPLRGGAIEKVYFALGQEFVRRGHQVTHISRTFQDLPKTETIGGVRHVRVDGFDSPSSSLVLKFLDLIYSRRVLKFLPEADILVTNTFWLPILARRKSWGKLYIHVARTPKGQLRFYSHAARLQTVSRSTLEMMRKEAPYLAPKFKCIHYPLARRSDQFTGLEVHPREKRLLYVGRIHPEKGIGLLLQSLAKIPPGVLSNWKLHIVGSAEARDGGGGPDYLDGLTKMALKLACQVVWKGPVFDPAILNEEYRRAALFLYPSLAEKGETFGLAPLEAMSEGCPPLVSNLACFKDFIEDGKTGFIFDHRTAEPAENLAGKLAELMSQPGLLQSIGAQAYERAKAFSLDRIADEYLADFASLASPVPEPATPLGERMVLLLWSCAWALFCRWTPKPFNSWRLFWLRLFGARIEGIPFVHQRARIQVPWNLTLRHRSCLGDRTKALGLGKIEIGERAVVAQEAFLGAGADDLALPGQAEKITVGEDAFIGARALVFPGIRVEKRGVVGACAVVTTDVAGSRMVAGNPARDIGARPE